MYKLIALDCDGTLLNKNKEITSRTIDVLLKAKEKEMKIVLATARPFYRIKKYLNQLGLIEMNQFSIAFNGGVVTNNTDNLLIYSNSFDESQVKELVEIGGIHKTPIFVYTLNGILSNFSDEKYKQKNPDVKFEVVDLTRINFKEVDVYKIVFVNSPEETIKLRNRLPQSLSDKYEISSSVPQFVEFVLKGVQKSNALEIICKKCGINKTEVIAFGDEDNDIPMLEYAGYSVAMGNANEKVKEIADYVTESNNNDGVAIVIEDLIL